MRPLPRLVLLGLAPLVLLMSGCHLVVPEVTTQTVTHNPFPQLSRVAVTPFFNQSDEPTVDGRQVASAYYAAVQATPGFEVIPVGVVERAMRELGLTSLDDPTKVRALGQMLEVDVVVVGAVTDFTPYYPPRCGMRVSWYATNPGYQEIPAGYGLPWGTPMEEYIPSDVVFDAEMALARAQLATQAPTLASPAGMNASPRTPSTQLLEPRPFPIERGEMVEPDPFDPSRENAAESLPAPGATSKADADSASGAVDQASHESPVSERMIGTDGPADPSGMFPADWPTAAGFTPPGPLPARPVATPHEGPVMTHTRLYDGANSEFTAALADYVGFRDDARLGDWQGYLERTDDFLRFCCHRHLSEMLIARGGGGETRVVSRWAKGR
ncbi:MAG: hypothetical protein AAFV43_13405 [Planctomycetota bacterium]